MSNLTVTFLIDRYSSKLHPTVLREVENNNSILFDLSKLDQNDDLETQVSKLAMDKLKEFARRALTDKNERKLRSKIQELLGEGNHFVHHDKELTIDQVVEMFKEAFVRYYPNRFISRHEEAFLLIDQAARRQLGLN